MVEKKKLMKIGEKIDRYQIRKQVLKDVVSYVKSGESVEYKKQIHELFWKYRKEGLDPKEAWEKAKRGLS